MNSVRPARPVASPVRASSAITSARPANVHHAFAPVIAQPPGVALGATGDATRRRSRCSGSVTEIAAMISPDASRGSHVCFCASVPPASSAFARISGRVISEPAAASDARDSSSVVRIIARLPSSWPP